MSLTKRINTLSYAYTARPNRRWKGIYAYVAFSAGGKLQMAVEIVPATFFLFSPVRRISREDATVIATGKWRVRNRYIFRRVIEKYDGNAARRSGSLFRCRFLDTSALPTADIFTLRLWMRRQLHITSPYIKRAAFYRRRRPVMIFWPIRRELEHKFVFFLMARWFFFSSCRAWRGYYRLEFFLLEKCRVLYW